MRSRGGVAQSDPDSTSEGSRPGSSRALMVPVEKMKEKTRKSLSSSSREERRKKRGSDQQKENKPQEHQKPAGTVCTDSRQHRPLSYEEMYSGLS